MRRPEVIREELRDLENVIRTHENLLKKFPNDKVLKLSLDQCLFRKGELEEELQTSIRKTMGKGGVLH